MIHVTISGKPYEIDFNGLPLGDAEFEISVNQKLIKVKLPGVDFGSLETGEAGYNLYLIIDGRPYEVSLDQDLRWIESSAGIFAVDLRDKDSNQPRVHHGDDRLKAPIPGLVTKVMVAEGEQVEAGQPILVLESMKMENEIRASHPGRVKSLLVSPGQSVSHHELLAEIVE